MALLSSRSFCWCSCLWCAARCTIRARRAAAGCEQRRCERRVARRQRQGRIAVRPDTVQSAIATLERPARYSRAITIERYYSGGSGVDRSSVSVDGAWMRVDTEQASGAQSHTISNGKERGSGTAAASSITRAPQPSPPTRSRASRRMRTSCALTKAHRRGGLPPARHRGLHLSGNCRR